MSIRLRILLILLIFIIVTIGLGAGSLLITGKQSQYYTTSNTYLQLRGDLRRASGIFNSMAQSFDYYIFLSQETERHNFSNLKRELTGELNRLSDRSISSKYVSDIRSKTRELNDSYERAMEFISNGNRTRAMEIAHGEVLSRVERIKELFDRKIKLVGIRVEASRTEAVAFRQRITNYFALSFGIVLLIMIFISFNLYRAISGPLKKFAKATDEIGSGNLDYNLKMEKENEFRKIADSINKMQKDLKEYQMKITQMGKMAAVGELSGGVAHEINNPLTGILGNLQRLLIKISPEDANYEIVKKMERAALRCRKIVSNLLEFSRNQTYDYKHYDIHEILEETFGLCETEVMFKNIKVEKKFDRNLPRVRASFRNLQQVFLNIINNAAHAMSKGGTLEIETEKIKKGRKDFLAVRFRDDGEGMPEEVKEKVFEPFYSTKDVGEGTGLGLSISYRIIKNHKGTIEISNSAPGKGTTISISLPL